jgi:pimeloyl-ACP methyl ester carboxylesterase
MTSQRVQINDIEMYYEIEGFGEPLLLLHGGTGCQENWAHAGRYQFVREYTLIKPDARGHGRTTNPQKRLRTGSARWTRSRSWITLASESAGPSD